MDTLNYLIRREVVNDNFFPIMRRCHFKNKNNFLTIFSTIFTKSSSLITIIFVLSKTNNYGQKILECFSKKLVSACEDECLLSMTVWFSKLMWWLNVDSTFFLILKTYKALITAAACVVILGTLGVCCRCRTRTIISLTPLS